MKKILLSLIFCGMLVFTPVQAQNDNTNGDAVAKGSNTTAEAAKEKVATIKTQAQELVGLRNQLRAKIKDVKKLVKTYRDQEQLTSEQIEEIKALTKSIKNVQQKLQSSYENVVQAKKTYKSDTSVSKLTGLDKVITSQQERITLLGQAIAELNY